MLRLAAASTSDVALIAAAAAVLSAAFTGAVTFMASRLAEHHERRESRGKFEHGLRNLYAEFQALVEQVPLDDDGQPVAGDERDALIGKYYLVANSGDDSVVSALRAYRESWANPPSVRESHIRLGDPKLFDALAEAMREDAHRSASERRVRIVRAFTDS